MYENQQYHLGLKDVIFCIMVTVMFRPLMWPSSGWFLWEQEYIYN